jgi:Holliday junction resolvase
VVDYIKVNRTRKNRGYSFEHGIVQFLQNIGWKAKRLGGSSTNLPDILATHDKTMYSMEAKSVMMPLTKKAMIPFDQVFRCIEMLTMFPVYEEKYLVFAFKFSLKGSSRPTYHYFAFDVNNTVLLKQFYQFPQYFVKLGFGEQLKIIPAEFVDKKLRQIAGAEPVPVGYSAYTSELPFKTPLTLYGNHMVK